MALAMELVDGEDLSTLIANGQPEGESVSSSLREGASAPERRAIDERTSLLVWLDTPWNDGLRDDPFMDELRRKVGLPEPRPPAA